MPGNKTSTYSFTLDKKNYNSESVDFLGKLRSNFVGTRFVQFTRGQRYQKDLIPGNMRKELLYIEFVE